MTTKEKMKLYLGYKGISPTGAERLLGWGVGALTKAKSITADRLQEFMEHFSDVSAEWLLRNAGPMIKEDAPQIDAERMKMMVSTIATLQGVIDDKNASLALAMERIKQLESQLKMI